MKDSYRQEVTKIAKKHTSGAAAEDTYAPKLAWFSKADSFLRQVLSTRKSTLNMLLGK
jgi:hypothetical protein